MWKTEATSCQDRRLAQRQEPAVAGGQTALSSGPGHSLRRHPAVRAIHPPRSVREVYGNPPERYELEPPSRKAVVTRPLAAAARANRPAVLPGNHLHFERRPAFALHPCCFSVHEGLERFDPIEDSLKLHPVVAPGEMVCCPTPSLTGIPAGCTCFSWPSPCYNSLVWRNGAGLCWRATRQGITRPGRVNDPWAPAASAARAFSSSPLSFICSAMPEKTHVNAAN